MESNLSSASLAAIVLSVSTFLDAHREYLPHGNEAPSEAVETIDPTVTQLSVAASSPVGGQRGRV